MRGYVLTGGPCVGKTSLVKELSRRGYEIVPEASSMLIARGLKCEEEAPGSGILPWTKPYEFRKLAISTTLELEDDAHSDDAFIDCGLLENKVYWEYYHGALPSEFSHCVQRKRYKGVFLLEMLPVYEHNGIRHQNAKEAHDIHERIRKVYEENDYSIVEVPILPVESRASFIIRNLVHNKR